MMLPQAAAAIANQITTQIRPLSRIELPQCVPMAQLFHAEFRLPGTFKASVWLKNWQTFYDHYTATVLGLFKHGQLVGGLGVMIVPDLCDGRLAGQELFWFVDPVQRNGLGGVRLLQAYHQWAKAHKAVEVRMVHLVNSPHADKLERLYQRFGYTKMEVSWISPIDDVMNDSETEEVG